MYIQNAGRLRTYLEVQISFILEHNSVIHATSWQRITHLTKVLSPSLLLASLGSVTSRGSFLAAFAAAEAMIAPLKRIGKVVSVV